MTKPAVVRGKWQCAPDLAGRPVPLPAGEADQRAVESVTAVFMQDSPARFVKSPIAIRTVGKVGVDRAGRQADEGGDDSQRS